MKTQTTLHLLYGLPAGETERYNEDLLATGTLARCEAIKPIAAKDGWHSFRIATHTDDGAVPDFARTVQI